MFSISVSMSRVARPAVSQVGTITRYGAQTTVADSIPTTLNLRLRQDDMDESDAMTVGMHAPPAKTRRSLEKEYIRTRRERGNPIRSNKGIRFFDGTGPKRDYNRPVRPILGMNNRTQLLPHNDERGGARTATWGTANMRDPTSTHIRVGVKGQMPSKGVYNEEVKQRKYYRGTNAVGQAYVKRDDRFEYVRQGENNAALKGMTDSIDVNSAVPTTDHMQGVFKGGMDIAPYRHYHPFDLPYKWFDQEWTSKSARDWTIPKKTRREIVRQGRFLGKIQPEQQLYPTVMQRSRQIYVPDKQRAYPDGTEPFLDNRHLPRESQDWDIFRNKQISNTVHGYPMSVKTYQDNFRPNPGQETLAGGISSASRGDYMVLDGVNNNFVSQYASPYREQHRKALDTRWTQLDITRYDTAPQILEQGPAVLFGLHRSRQGSAIGGHYLFDSSVPGIQNSMNRIDPNKVKLGGTYGDVAVDHNTTQIFGPKTNMQFVNQRYQPLGPDYSGEKINSYSHPPNGSIGVGPRDVGTPIRPARDEAFPNGVNGSSKGLRRVYNAAYLHAARQ